MALAFDSLDPFSPLEESSGASFQTLRSPSEKPEDSSEEEYDPRSDFKEMEEDDTPVRSLIKSLICNPNTEVINLNGEKISDDDLEYLSFYLSCRAAVEQAKPLQEIDLSQALSITPQGVLNFLDHLQDGIVVPLEDQQGDFPYFFDLDIHEEKEGNVYLKENNQPLGGYCCYMPEEKVVLKLRSFQTSSENESFKKNAEDYAPDIMDKMEIRFL